MATPHARASTRTVLARLLAVVAVIVGLVLIQASFCQDQSAVPGAPELSALVVTSAADHAASLDSAEVPGDHERGAWACLLVLLAILVIALRWRRPFTLVQPVTFARPISRASWARRTAPLSFLCVFRT